MMTNSVRSRTAREASALHRLQTGFSLIELLTVIAVLSVLG